MCTKIQDFFNKVKYLLVLGAVFVLVLLVVRGYVQNLRAAAVYTPAQAITLPKDTEVLPIRIVPQEQARKRLHVELPATQGVTAAADIKPSKTGYVALSVLDRTTGDTEIRVTEKPQEPLGWSNATRWGIGIGVDSRHGYTGKVFAEYTPLRILTGTVGVEAEARASADGNLAGYAGVKVFF